jgi:hypothetical protein
MFGEHGLGQATVKIVPCEDVPWLGKPHVRRGAPGDLRTRRDLVSVSLVSHGLIFSPPPLVVNEAASVVFLDIQQTSHHRNAIRVMNKILKVTERGCLTEAHISAEGTSTAASSR